MNNAEIERNITITIGKSFSMYGVKDIRAFDEGFVSLDTASGRISVEGKELKIESLSKENGHIYINGDISGVFCETEAEGKKGFVRRIFGK